MWSCEPQPKARRVYECGRASRSRRRGEPVNVAVRPPGLARVAPVLVTLLVVWMAGGLWLARRGAERHEVAVADTVAAVRALVDAAQRELRRESALLAKDPTIVEGALKRDWATLARGASPRMLALTLERTADLLLVLDATGAPLVQVPATPRVEVLALSRPAEAVTRVAVVNSYAYLVGLAPGLVAARSASPPPAGESARAPGERVSVPPRSVIRAPSVETDHADPAPTEGRGQELEAVHAIAVATGGGDDLVATAERMLE